MSNTGPSSREIEEMYDSGDLRLTQERNDFLLPQVDDFVSQKKWINLRPEYQRRLVWSNKKKSLLIESLLMNVPIPPVFLYEHDLSRYEVMDGQQRLNAIVEFYQNRLKLTGLEKWKALNGKTYSDCPPRIQKGLDRRRMSATVLLAESGKDEKQVAELRRLVFERLNTGGQNLNPQELRNAVRSGKFNDLIVELAGFRLFNDIWGIPAYEDNIRNEHVSKQLLDNALYRRMQDCEYVLRFFAFRRKSKLRGSVRKILDNCMDDYENASLDEIEQLRTRFKETLMLAYRVFEGKPFIARDGKLSTPLYDAVMVALDLVKDHEDTLLESGAAIRGGVERLIQDDDSYEVIVGRPNTAKAIKARLSLVGQIFHDAL